MEQQQQQQQQVVLEWAPAHIIYDERTQQYNYPFVVTFAATAAKKQQPHQQTKWSCDFFVRATDFANQEAMLRARMAACAKQLLAYFVGVFEQLQEICLTEGVDASDATVDNINGLFDVLFHVFVVFGKIHTSAHCATRVQEVYAELTEMYLLLEDYYTISRKKELYEWKHKLHNLMA